MSFHDIPITVSAENRATAEFVKVASDAAHMASEVAAHPITIRAEDLASADVNRVAEEVTVLTTSFESCSVEAANMGAEVLDATESVTVGFQQAGEEAENLAAKVSLSRAQIREAARDFTQLGVGISAIGRLGEEFGF